MTVGPEGNRRASSRTPGTPAGSDLPGCTFAGVRIVDVGPHAAVRLLREWSQAEIGLAVHLCNAYTLSLAARSPAYARTLMANGVNLPDGVPVAWFSRLQTGHRSRGAVRGPGLLRAALNVETLRHFFLGGTVPLLEQLVAAARIEHPAVVVAGTHAPAFGPVGEADLDAWAAAITASGANIVWVGLGTPKQDEVVAALAGRVPAVLVGIGAAFDFVSGVKPEAPPWMHGTGIEWTHRLATEPRRLWRRYLVGNIVFSFYAVKEIIRGRSATGERA